MRVRLAPFAMALPLLVVLSAPVITQSQPEQGRVFTEADYDRVFPAAGLHGSHGHGTHPHRR